MADIEMLDVKGLVEALPKPPPRKKFKTSELPLTASQRGAVDQLLLTFKKKGGFDSLRKEIWNEYGSSEAKDKFTTSLTDLAESEVERDPSLLSRERGKAANLMTGALDRSYIYKTVEADIDALIAKHLDQVLSSVREIRKQDVGEEAAVEEERTGSKTDEDYERETDARRQERDRIRLRQQELQKQIEEEKAKIRAEEQRKEREIAKRKEAEERAREAEREAKKKAERDQEREELRALEEVREREREERYERRRREEKERLREREAAYSSRRVSLSYEHPDTPTKERTPQQAPPVDEKSLEEAALELLLKEGQELAAKSKAKPEFDFEQAEKVESSTRKTQTQRLRDDDRRSSRGDIRDSRGERSSHSHSSRYHDRSRSPHDRGRHSDYDRRTKHHHSHSSRSPSRGQGQPHDEDTRMQTEQEAFEARKVAAALEREKEALAYKRERERERTVREPTDYRGRTKSPSGNSYDYERETREKRPHRREYSRSRSPRRRGRSRSRSPPRRTHRERSTKRRHSRERSTEVQAIDRYVPEGGRRSPAPVRRIRKDDRKDERREERRDDRRDDRKEERGAHRSRSPRREKEDRREERRGFVEIDRYVPGKK